MICTDNYNIDNYSIVVRASCNQPPRQAPGTAPGCEVSGQDSGSLRQRVPTTLNRNGLIIDQHALFQTSGRVSKALHSRL